MTGALGVTCSLLVTSHVRQVCAIRTSISADSDCFAFSPEIMVAFQEHHFQKLFKFRRFSSASISNISSKFARWAEIRWQRNQLSCDPWPFNPSTSKIKKYILPTFPKEIHKFSYFAPGNGGVRQPIAREGGDRPHCLLHRLQEEPLLHLLVQGAGPRVSSPSNDKCFF